MDERRSSRVHFGLLASVFAGIVCVLAAIGLAGATTRAADSSGTAMTPTHAAYVPFVSIPDATPVPDVPDWLAYVNQFREEGNVSSLAENEAWSYGGQLHGRYMVKNDIITHSEDPGNPWYTPEGAAAGANGNVMVSSSTSTPDEWAVDLWMAGPFHAIAILDPALHTTGFGVYREAIGTWRMGATLDVLRGLGAIPGDTIFPLPFPRNGGETWLTRYNGGEWPDPLSSCPGYTTPSGPPLMIQVGPGNGTPNVTSSSFMLGSTSLPHCTYDETDYVNSDAGAQSTGRAVLGSRDAVVIMPRNPLTLGESYSASVTVNGITHVWNFTVVGEPSRENGGDRFQFR